jgi:hypothetical protein
VLVIIHPYDEDSVYHIFQITKGDLLMKRLLYNPGCPGKTFFQCIIDRNNLEHALRCASRAKPHDPEVLYILNNKGYYIDKLYTMLISNQFHTSEYTVFKKNDNGKDRIIYKLPFYPDRIVHWAVLLQIGPVLLSKFISNSYSSIPGKGPLSCMMKVYNDLRKYPDETFYCLKLDICKFYPSINHEILKNMYLRIFKDMDLLNIIFDVIDSVDESEGIPIGNYLSQFSGNLYLTGFDHWIKEEKHVWFYYRYMDDMVFLSDSKDKLHELLDDIKIYLNDKLKLTLKPNHRIFPVDDGLDYVGYVIYHDHVLTRKRIVDGYKRCVSRCINKCVLTQHDISQYYAYKGFIKHSNSYNLHKRYGYELERKFGLI